MCQDCGSSDNACGNPAGFIFKSVMDRVHKNLEEKQFDFNSDIVKKYYCSVCGKLASSSTGSSMVGWYKSDNLPGYCSGHASLHAEETTSTTNTQSNNQGAAPDNGVEGVTPVEPDIPPYQVVPEFN